MKQRVLTATLLIPPVLLAVFLYSPFLFWALALVAASIAHHELCRLAGARPAPPILPFVLMIGAVCVCWLTAKKPHGAPDLAVVRLVSGGLVAASCVGVVGAIGIARGRRGAPAAAVASLWIGAPLASLMILKIPFGDVVPMIDHAPPMLLAILPIWIGDTLAMLAGRAFGKHLLAARISPKKTWEGAIANLIGCIAGAAAVGAWIGVSPLAAGLAGVATGVLGQAGDLLESAMKRSADVKDSGTLLPGHGGLLDRIDSILLSAPAVVLILVAFGSR